MCDSPNPLQDICIDFLSDLRNGVFLPVRDVEGNIVRYEFPDGSVFLPACLSEALLEALGRKGLRPSALALFTSPRTHLGRIQVGDASRLRPADLRAALSPHRISQLSVRALSCATVNDLVACLGEWTVKNLRLLDVSRGKLGDVRVAFALSKLQNLNSLDLSYTELTSQGLRLVSQELRLERLSVAGTRVADAGAAVRWPGLRHLDLADLRLAGGWAELAKLRQLRHIDLSTSEANEEAPLELLAILSALPELVSLDVSGRRGLHAVRAFVSTKPRMQFLGLLENEACLDGAFCDDSDPAYNPKLVVTGFGSEQQVLASLRRYQRRESFLHKALCYLYVHVQNLTEARPDITELVLLGMARFPGALQVQVAGTACLYGLQRHCGGLRRLADATLDAMQLFPKHLRLQKNALLTLCNERMLQDESLDRYRCAELALNSLLNFHDPALNRMAVAICSVLASRISSASNLGAKSHYMIRLLDIVRNKTQTRENDVMMKFTLSALWNLTDESPKTCVVFLDQGGLQLFLDVLTNFDGDSSVETKILGLMNNVAEVELLREDLRKAHLIGTLRRLLRSERVEVSYFAAGVVAHLASDGEESWRKHDDDWATTLHELEEAVSRWELPPTEMVAYRSFRPFYPLLRHCEVFQVRLWAAWAVNHVCSKNPDRYCHLLEEEGGAGVVEQVLLEPALNADVAVLCRDILQRQKNQTHGLT